MKLTCRAQVEEPSRELINTVAIERSRLSVRGSGLFRLSRRRAGISNTTCTSLCQLCGFSCNAKAHVFSDAHAHVLAAALRNHVPVATGTVPPVFSAESRNFARPVMESTEGGESKADLGLVIIDTACLFCVAGSEWWTNFKNLLVDVGLRHEIDETRAAERYTFVDGGTFGLFHKSYGPRCDC